MEQKPFAEAVVDSIREYCDKHFDGNVRKMSEFLGIDPDSGVVHRWLRDTGAGPTLAKIGPVMDKLGITICPKEQPMSDSNKLRELADMLPDLGMQLECAADNLEKLPVAAQQEVEDLIKSILTFDKMVIELYTDVTHTLWEQYK